MVSEKLIGSTSVDDVYHYIREITLCDMPFMLMIYFAV